MADLIHMKNLIQGEVIHIRERSPLGQQPERLEELIVFLKEQATSVELTKKEVVNQIKEKVGE